VGAGFHTAWFCRRILLLCAKNKKCWFLRKKVSPLLNSMGADSSRYITCSDGFSELDNDILGSFDLASSRTSFDFYDLRVSITGTKIPSITVCSLIGSSFVVVHFLLRDKRGLVLSQLIFWLSMADLGASIVLTVSESWLLLANYSEFICYALRSCIQFFVVSSWMWTSCIAYYAFHAIVFFSDIFLKEVHLVLLFSLLPNLSRRTKELRREALTYS